MTEQQISNGRYRLHFAHGSDAVTAERDLQQIILGRPDSEAAVWEVASDGAGGHTLRNVQSGVYLGSANDPTSPSMTLEGVSAPFAWKIEPGPESGTVSLSPSASNGTMRLAPSLLRIFPPRLAWLPTSEGSPDQSWRLARA